MKRMLGQRSLLMVAVGVIISALAVTGITAHAKTTNKSSSSTARKSTTLVTKPFRFTKVAYANDPKVKACVRITVYGTFQYKRTLTDGPGYKGLRFLGYSDRKIIAPTMTAKAFSAPNCSGPEKAVRLSGAELEQRWYATDCTFNPGISVSPPWGVSIQPTASCGDVTAAQRTTRFSVAASSYRQSNSSKVISFPKHVGGGLATGQKTLGCVSLDASVQVYKKNGSDNADAKKFMLCPTSH